MNKKTSGNIPLLHTKGESIPEAWENSVVELYNNGLWWHRQGSKDKGRLNLDSTMVIEISNPDSDLIMHKYMTCGPEELFEYQMEILGAKDSWVNLSSESTKWPYHYHERLASYPGTKTSINQIEEMIKGLSEEPWKRRNNMITWVPERDIKSKDPPCLQKLWAIILPDEENDLFKLNINYVFRSRNVMIAAPMNMVGLYTLQSYMKDRIIKNTGINLENGRLVDINDSYHVSADNQNILEGFMDRLEKSKARGETTIERCFDKEIVFYYVDKKRVENKIIEQTRKELIEKNEEYKLESEIEKIKQISQEVSKINRY